MQQDWNLDINIIPSSSLTNIQKTSLFLELATTFSRNYNEYVKRYISLTHYCYTPETNFYINATIFDALLISMPKDTPDEDDVWMQLVWIIYMKINGYIPPKDTDLISVAESIGCDTNVIVRRYGHNISNSIQGFDVHYSDRDPIGYRETIVHRRIEKSLEYMKGRAQYLVRSALELFSFSDPCKYRNAYTSIVRSALDKHNEQNVGSAVGTALTILGYKKIQLDSAASTMQMYFIELFFRVNKPRLYAQINKMSVRNMLRSMLMTRAHVIIVALSAIRTASASEPETTATDSGTLKDWDQRFTSLIVVSAMSFVGVLSLMWSFVILTRVSFLVKDSTSFVPERDTIRDMMRVYKYKKIVHIKRSPEVNNRYIGIVWNGDRLCILSTIPVLWLEISAANNDTGTVIQILIASIVAAFLLTPSWIWYSNREAGGLVDSLISNALIASSIGLILSIYVIGKITKSLFRRLLYQEKVGSNIYGAIGESQIDHVLRWSSSGIADKFADPRYINSDAYALLDDNDFVLWMITQLACWSGAMSLLKGQYTPYEKVATTWLNRIGIDKQTLDKEKRMVYNAEINQQEISHNISNMLKNVDTKVRLLNGDSKDIRPMVAEITKVYRGIGLISIPEDQTKRDSGIFNRNVIIASVTFILLVAISISIGLGLGLRNKYVGISVSVSLIITVAFLCFFVVVARHIITTTRSKNVTHTMLPHSKEPDRHKDKASSTQTVVPANPEEQNMHTHIVQMSTTMPVNSGERATTDNVFEEDANKMVTSIGAIAIEMHKRNNSSAATTTVNTEIETV